MQNDVQSCGSTTIPPDLLGYREWLRQVDHGSTTWKILDAFTDEIISDYESGAATTYSENLIPWSRVSGRFIARKVDEAPSALTKVLKPHTMQNWFQSRHEGYSDFCKQRGFRKLKFHIDNSGAVTLYGFIPDDDVQTESHSYRLSGSVMTWERHRVPVEDMRWIAQKLMPNGERLMRGPARWIFITYIMSLMMIQIAIALIVLASVVLLERTVLTAINTMIWAALALSFTWFVLRPKARNADLRTMPAWSWILLKSGPPAWIDRIRVPIEGKPEGSFESNWQLVRWQADCPICGAELELRQDSQIRPGELTGCCMDSFDEHSFTFDRVTREGRPLRSTLRDRTD